MDKTDRKSENERERERVDMGQPPRKGNKLLRKSSTVLMTEKYKNSTGAMLNFSLTIFSNFL